MLSALLVSVLASNGSWTCAEEDLRVTQHLEDALTQLQTATPPGLSDAQRSAREGLLRDLRRYIDASEFPRSTGPTSPVFVDATENHCAMGALLAWNGASDVVRHIRQTRNLATVPTLVDEPGLAAWLVEHGMTVEEAALVQPTYYVCTPAIDVCVTSRFPQTWLANGRVSPLGIPDNSRAAMADGACAAPRGDRPILDMPFGVIHQYPSGLVPSGEAYVHASWARCRNPLRISKAALSQSSVEACMRAMVEEDARALLSSCGYDFDSAQLGRCAEDGRFLSERLPYSSVAGALDSYFMFRDIDAGLPSVDFTALERAAWAHSDDGGTVPAGDLAPLTTWSGTNPSTCEFLDDGGIANVVLAAGPPPVVPEAPASGCSVGLGSSLALVALLLRRRVTAR